MDEPTFKPQVKDTFKTPEEIAKMPTTFNKSNPMPKKSKKNLFTWFKKLSKKQKVTIYTLIVLILIGLLISLILSAKNQSVSVVTRKNVTTAIKTTPLKPSNLVASNLTGDLVNPSVNNQPVMAVMIENTPYARPQSGLGQAGVVFEALAEGGITRFVALFQNKTPSSIGPVRSVRPYFLDWVDAFDPVFVHVGGSQQGLSYINTLGIRNIDQIADSSPFQRISSRPAPHNVYTSYNNLLSFSQSMGWTSSNYQGFNRLSQVPTNNKAIVTSINFNPSYSTYSDQYSYDANTNRYLRSEDGTALTDAINNQQIAPRVVIAMIVPWSQGSLDTSNAYYSVYQDIGSGQAYIFQNGNVTIGQWTKTSPTNQISFTDSNGNTIKLDPGQTWITVLGASNQLSYN